MRRFLPRGPRLGTKLMMLGAALLIVPWFSFRQLVEMESFLVQGQSQAQLLTAEGVSTLLNGREDLFNDLPISLDGYEALYAHPLPAAVRIDGRDNDWEALLDKRQRFGGATAAAAPAAAGGDATQAQAAPKGVDDGAFELLLGERGGQLYAFLTVHDDVRVWRNPNYLRLDNADHVRLSYVTSEGRQGRLQIALQEPGVTTAYHMDSDWRFARDGQPENRLQGFMEETGDGYSVEFRIPLDMLGSRRSFGLSVVDVDNAETREIRSITQTLPTAGPESFNLVVLRSPEVLNIIRGLGYSGARILVVDRQRRVRAETGSYQSATDEPEPAEFWNAGFFDFLRPLVRSLLDVGRDAVTPLQGSTAGEQVIQASLDNRPAAVLRRLANGEEIIMAAHPIIASDRIIGTVVVEQNTDDILDLQRVALERIILVSGASLLAVFLVLLAFSIRLAWRIRSLGAETINSIDQNGRLKTSQLHREIDAGDEIGDLARSVSNMLSKLHQHNQFLENMPRTLRHEINNPLNTLSTSLQNLEQERPELATSKYLESARRGVMRIGAIVQNLADAANLEESLGAEELEVIDIEQLLENYVSNCRNVHPNRQFIFRGAAREVRARVADYRIEQLLDKIIDNAVDFQRPGTPIRVLLDVRRDVLEITVANQGPPLDADILGSLFDSMVTRRTTTRDNRLHFGLGLYVVRVIAERHGGSVRAANLPGGDGVAVTVTLPLAEPLPQVRLKATG
ncbi:MAG TPA: ATP-binding protein [Pseudomonadales bacterium]|nr:ATP-binding protein [Pseudomonadales bacterium]